MAIRGPRPNPNPSQAPIPPTDPIIPALPSTSTSSSLPYPHQSSPESGTTLLEPAPQHATIDDISPAERLRRQWQDYLQTADGSRKFVLTGALDPEAQSQGHIELESQYDLFSRQAMSPEHRSTEASFSIRPEDSASQQHRPIAYIPLSTSDDHSRHVKNKPSYLGGLSYIDENGEYHKSQYDRPASAMYPNEAVEMQSLVSGAANMGMETALKVRLQGGSDSPLDYPSPDDGTGRGRGGRWDWLLFSTGLDRIVPAFWTIRDCESIDQLVERKKRGLGGQRWPVAAWIMTIGMIFGSSNVIQL